jgi:hypothetical protein
MALLLSAGFVSFIDAPSGINLRYYAIVKMDFYYQIKRGALFLCCIYGAPFIVFLANHAKAQPGNFIFPFLGLMGMMFLSLGLAFMGGNIILRALFGLSTACLMALYSRFDWRTVFVILLSIIAVAGARNNFFGWEWT